MARRPTILDVAAAAGVSKSTVSLVLQGSALVKPSTVEKVREAMGALGYVYNRTAAQLRSAQSGLVGLVINDLRNPFFTEFAASVQMAFYDRGYATVIANTDEDPDLQAQVVGSMVEHGVHALVLSPSYGDDDATFEAIRRAGIPAMQVLRRVNPDIEAFPFAAPDYGRGGILATRHLVDSGARRIAFVGGISSRAVTRQRFKGYLKVLTEEGLEPIVMHGRTSRAFGREAAFQILRDRPDIEAAVCFNDLVALGMMSGFAERGRTLGTDFQLVGFDDIEECAQVFPKLSSVRCDIGGFGRFVACTMLDWLEGGPPPKSEQLTEVELIVRETSGVRRPVPAFGE